MIEEFQTANNVDIARVRSLSLANRNTFQNSQKEYLPISVGKEVVEVPFVNSYNEAHDVAMSVSATKHGVVQRLNKSAIEGILALNPESPIKEYASLISEREEKKMCEKLNSRRKNAVDVAMPGFQQPITTLTYVFNKVVNQLLTQEDFSKIFPLFDGAKAASWYETITLLTGRAIAPDNIASYRVQGSNFQSLKNITTENSRESFPISTYVFQVPNNMIVQSQASLVNIDMQTQQISLALEAIMNAYSKALMVGPGDESFDGFLTNPAFNVDTTLFNDYYSNLTSAQKTHVLTSFISEYFANSGATMMPDTFLISKFDSTGFGSPFSGSYPSAYTTGLSLEIGLQQVQQTADYISQQIGSSGIKVVSSAFVDSKVNGVLTRYSLFNSDPSNIGLLETIPITVNATTSADGFHMNTIIYFRTAGIQAIRPTSVLQFSVN
jgi:hypothetical protein